MCHRLPGPGSPVGPLWSHPLPQRGSKHSHLCLLFTLPSLCLPLILGLLTFIFTKCTLPPPPQKARGRSVWLAVHEGGVSLLCPSSMETRSHYSWPQLAAFGSDGDHLVLVVTSSQNGSHDNTDTEKLLFFMSKAKVSPYFTHKPQNHLFLYT